MEMFRNFFKKLLANMLIGFSQKHNKHEDHMSIPTICKFILVIHIQSCRCTNQNLCLIICKNTSFQGGFSPQISD